MDVKIVETKKIVPSTPIHDHELSLSHLDNDPNVDIIFRYLRVYTSTVTDLHPFDVCSTSLSAALTHYYPLTGTLRRENNDQRFKLTCQENKGVPLITATVDITLESINYLDDYDAELVKRLVPDPSPEQILDTPCVLQVTVFKCGGWVMGTAIHHAMADGIGATQFFNMMAEFARGIETPSVLPVWDRARLLGPRDPTRAEEGPVKEFLKVKKGVVPYRQDVGRTVSECFKVTDECLDKLKGVLFEKSGLGFTTFEALGAYLWRAKERSIGSTSDEEVKFAYPTNIRRIIKPALPVGYWGNGCVPMYAQLSAKELVEQPLWKTAELIKKSKSNMSDDYVRSFIDFQEIHYGQGITAGDGVSGVSDWRHIGHATVDFGWGGPVTVVPVSTNLLGSVEPSFFLPHSSANAGKKDGFKVMMTLRESAMPAFREEMEKFSNKEFDL